MKIAFYSTKEYDTTSFSISSLSQHHEITYIPDRLDKTTVHHATGHDAVCIFVNDDGSAQVLDELASVGVRAVALRCAGFNNVDLNRSDELGINVVRVPAYSPESVAEFAVGHALSVVRKYHKAHALTSSHNFTLSSLVGFNLHKRTVGIVGTGKIGVIAGKIFQQGFGAKIISYDPFPSPAALELGFEYVSLDELLARSDVISLHCPLMPSTKHIINAESLAKTKPGVVIVNTSRGGLIDTSALLDSLEKGHVGGVGLDVYEREEELFFEDHSDSGKVHEDQTFARLLALPNVIVTGHQAFLTEEALENIATTTLSNLLVVEKNQECLNAVRPGA